MLPDLDPEDEWGADLNAAIRAITRAAPVAHADIAALTEVETGTLIYCSTHRALERYNGASWQIWLQMPAVVNSDLVTSLYDEESPDIWLEGQTVTGMGGWNFVAPADADVPLAAGTQYNLRWHRGGHLVRVSGHVQMNRLNGWGTTDNWVVKMGGSRVMKCIHKTVLQTAYEDVSAGTVIPGYGVMDGYNCTLYTGDGQRVKDTVPFQWANGDRLYISGHWYTDYEIGMSFP